MLEEGNEDAQVATHTASSVENSTGGVGTTSGTTAFSLPEKVLCSSYPVTHEPVLLDHVVEDSEEQDVGGDDTEAGEELIWLYLACPGGASN